MIDYTTLKHSSDGMPTWDAYLGIILKLATNKPLWTADELKTAAVNELDLPDELRNKKYNSKYMGNVAKNRAGFALSNLKIAGYLHSPKRGEYEITQLGKNAWEKYGLNLTRAVVHEEPLYKQYKTKKVKDKSTNSDASESIDSLNKELIQDWFNQKTDELKDQLLAKLTEMNPYAFEGLMVELLNRMGYKGPNGQSIVTQKSNDNGIDGVIYQDALGLQKVYLQVKRYAPNNPVGRPEITSFSGAVKLKHTDRGVFITTSTFTTGAEEAAQNLNITTIDGEMLTNLMVQYRVGVEEAKTYHIYRINKDDFTD